MASTTTNTNTTVAVSTKGHIGKATCEAFPEEPGILYARLRYAERMRDRLLSQVSGENGKDGGGGGAKFERFTSDHLDKLKMSSTAAQTSPEAAPVLPEPAAATTTPLPKSDAQRESERVERLLKALPLLKKEFGGWAFFDARCNYMAVLPDSVPLFAINDFPWVRFLVHTPSFKLLQSSEKASNINVLTALDNYLDAVPVITPLLFALLNGGKPHELGMVPVYVCSLTLYGFYCNVRMWLMEQDDADALARTADTERKHKLAEQGNVTQLEKDCEEESRLLEKQRRDRAMRSVADVRRAVEHSTRTIGARLQQMYTTQMDGALQSNATAKEEEEGGRLTLTQLATGSTARRVSAKHTVQVLRALEAQIITLLRLPSTSITALGSPAKTFPTTEDVDTETLDDCRDARLVMLDVLRQVACQRNDDAKRLSAKELAASPFCKVDIDTSTTLVEAYLYMRQCRLASTPSPSPAAAAAAATASPSSIKVAEAPSSQ